MVTKQYKSLAALRRRIEKLSAVYREADDLIETTRKELWRLYDQERTLKNRTTGVAESWTHWSLEMAYWLRDSRVSDDEPWGQPEFFTSKPQRDRASAFARVMGGLRTWSGQETRAEAQQRAKKEQVK